MPNYFFYTVPQLCYLELVYVAILTTQFVMNRVSLVHQQWNFGIADILSYTESIFSDVDSEMDLSDYSLPACFEAINSIFGHS